MSLNDAIMIISHMLVGVIIFVTVKLVAIHLI